VSDPELLLSKGEVWLIPKNDVLAIFTASVAPVTVTLIVFAPVAGALRYHISEDIRPVEPT
jgi:hypothetical protein